MTHDTALRCPNHPCNHYSSIIACINWIEYTELIQLFCSKSLQVESGHTAEVVTTLKGTTFRVAETSPDMYASIDLVANRLARKLRKYKERRLEGYHGGPNMGENLADVLSDIEVEEDAVADEVENYIDPEQAVITKVKR